MSPFFKTKHLFLSQTQQICSRSTCFANVSPFSDQNPTSGPETMNMCFEGTQMHRISPGIQWNTSRTPNTKQNRAAGWHPRGRLHWSNHGLGPKGLRPSGSKGLIGPWGPKGLSVLGAQRTYRSSGPKGPVGPRAQGA